VNGNVGRANGNVGRANGNVGRADHLDPRGVSLRRMRIAGDTVVR
jgi:hypothetical protein